MSTLYASAGMGLSERLLSVAMCLITCLAKAPGTGAAHAEHRAGVWRPLQVPHMYLDTVRHAVLKKGVDSKS